MANDEIQKISVEIQNIHDKMLQALKLHTEVALKRSAAIAYLDKMHFKWDDKKGLAEKARFQERLKDCHNDEKMIMKITEPAISRTYKILSDLTEGKKKKLDKEEREILDSMFKALEFMEEKIHLTKIRIDKEAEYLDSPIGDRFNTYNTAWKNERTADEKLLNTINPAYLNQWATLKNVDYGQILKETTMGTAGTGVAGLVLKLAGVHADAKDIGVIMIYALIGISIGEFISQYIKATKSVLTQQQEAILKFQLK